MDKFKEGFRSAASAGPTAAEWVAVLAEDFPALTSALVGSYNPEDKTWGMPPLSLSIFDDQGTLKFCLTRKGLSRVFFSTIDDPSKVLGSIDRAIAEGRGEWKDKRR